MALTYQQLAQQSLDIQDACNLSGVVHAFSRAMETLRAHPDCTGTDWINTHPIVTLFIDKLASLNRTQQDLDAVSKAYTAVHEIIAIEIWRDGWRKEGREDCLAGRPDRTEELRGKPAVLPYSEGWATAPCAQCGSTEADHRERQEFTCGTFKTEAEWNAICDHANDHAQRRAESGHAE